MKVETECADGEVGQTGGLKRRRIILGPQLKIPSIEMNESSVELTASENTETSHQKEHNNMTAI